MCTLSVSSAGFSEIIYRRLFAAGQSQVTEYLTLARQELIEERDRLKGDTSVERFRIMNIGMPPVLLLGTIEKFSKEYNAVSVSDLFSVTWGEGQLNFSSPLEAILDKIKLNPVMTMYGRWITESLIWLLTAPFSIKVDGAIYYAHIGCRQSSAL